MAKADAAPPATPAYPPVPPVNPAQVRFEAVKVAMNLPGINQNFDDMMQAAETMASFILGTDKPPAATPKRR